MVLWLKRWHPKDILKLTDLYFCPYVQFIFFLLQRYNKAKHCPAGPLGRTTKQLKDCTWGSNNVESTLKVIKTFTRANNNVISFGPLQNSILSRKFLNSHLKKYDISHEKILDQCLPHVLSFCCFIVLFNIIVMFVFCHILKALLCTNLL